MSEKELKKANKKKINFTLFKPKVKIELHNRSTKTGSLYKITLLNY